MSSKWLLILGSFNKKLLIPFFLALDQILYNIIILYYPGESSQIIESYSISIGHMLNLIIPHIKFFSNKSNKLATDLISKEEKKNCSKYCILHYFLLICLYNIESLLIIISSLLIQNSEETNTTIKLPHIVGPFTKESLIIILISLISFFLLKYKYYIHHNISLVSFIIMGIIIDLILNNFQKEFNRSSIIIIINLVEIIFETINFCYQKYMIDVLYYNYYNIVFALGLSLFICNTIAIPYFITNEKQKKIFLDSFDNIGILISRFIFIMILQFIFFLLRILTLAYFTPHHLLICLSISKFVVTSIDEESPLKYASIIPFIFQFFSLMIFLEIIELNFCGLNKNSKRNIQKRGEIETSRHAKELILLMENDEND